MTRDGTAPPLPDELRNIEEAVAVPTQPALRAITGVLGATLTLVCLGWALSVPRHLGVAFFTEQLLALVLGLALAIVYAAVDWKGRRHAGLPRVDVVLGFIGLAACSWVAWQYPRLLEDVPYRTPELLVLSAIIILLVLEGLRRCTGWTLLGVVLAFLAYSMVAHLAPEEIRGRPLSVGPLAIYLAFDPSAVFGPPMVVGATVVIMYLWMGAVLNRSGGGEFFNDIALALFGRARGGPAKICVVGSALFGTISGSAVSNVVSTGVFTIPMMKRTGYSARDAGAIEAVSSTGGQLMPPVMGAAAFLMAEFLQVSYGEIVIAAVIPALLYYWGEYVQVDLMAGRAGLARLSDAIPAVAAVLREGWHFIVPFVVLLFILFYWDEEPEIAAIAASVSMLAGGMLKPYRSGKKVYRLRPVDLFTTLAATGRMTGDLFLTLAAAGFVIGVLNATGLGFALTLWLVEMGGDSVFVLLLVAAVVSIILGMGMPTTAVYVLLAALVAPSLIKAGIEPIAAHMFILYFGMLSMITPPVALAAYAAAGISKAGAFETGWAACRIGWTAFVIPFMFVLSPTLLAQGSLWRVAYDAGSAAFGVYLVTAAIAGWYRRPLSPVTRLVLGVAGLAAILPDARVGIVFPGFVSACGIAVGLFLIAVQYLAARRAAVTERAAG